jgi:hypothetical protein
LERLIRATSGFFRGGGESADYGWLRLDGDRDHINADGYAVAMAKRLRGSDPVMPAIDESAIRRQVIQPVSACTVVYFAVSARNKPMRIGQRPAELAISADG